MVAERRVKGEEENNRMRLTERAMEHKKGCYYLPLMLCRPKKKRFWIENKSHLSDLFDQTGWKEQYIVILTNQTRTHSRNKKKKK